MQILNIEFYYDPGHGWYKVAHSVLAQLSIADKISGYSYMHGSYAYLEEDCDATLFFKVAESAGIKVNIIYPIDSYREQSHIRDYKRYQDQNQNQSQNKLTK